ncbi:divalent-cation tolerance protein CutA, partial [Serratia nevei]|uniref:divalent-cation tolerance protein CutA n=1 Tax=Serratia nevei TaxID=2703794 RepID=UPI003D35CF0B
PVSALICFCTCPDADSAERIATALVAERLAACVNLLPGLRSVYRWQRKVEAAAEVLLLVKTSAEAYPALQERLRQLHPYELPELLAVEAASGLPRPAGTPAPTASLRTPGAARGRSRVRPARIPAMAGRREPTGKLSQ